MSDVSRLLSAVEAGDKNAAGELLPLVYEELRKLASARLAHESAGQTLQPTALVHEAYLRLVGPADQNKWENRAHFFAAAAEAMRRILVDNARKKRGAKKGGNLKRQDLDLQEPANPEQSDLLIELSEALDRLAEEEPRAAQVVKLRYFTGMTIPEVAEALEISARTADSDWAYARAWLAAALNPE